MRLPISTITAASTALAAAALVIPLLGTSAVAAPASTPHPAAPAGGCALTQDVDATTTTLSGLRLSKPRLTISKRNAYRDGKTWRAYTEATVTWNTTVTATTTQRYASADCGIPARTVTSTARRTSKVTTFTVTARPQGATKKAALKESRARVMKRSKRYARAEAEALATDKALLKGRLAFIRTLPTRPVTTDYIPAKKLTGKQACPATLPVAKRNDWRTTTAPATVVPQFTTPAAIWLCTYPYLAEGPAVRRVKVTGAQKARILAGVRGLTPPSPTKITACPSIGGPTTLISLVSAAGDVTGVVVDHSGCTDATMTSNPRRHVGGLRDSVGVPQGRFDVSTSLRTAITRSAGA